MIGTVHLRDQFSKGHQGRKLNDDHCLLSQSVKRLHDNAVLDTPYTILLQCRIEAISPLTSCLANEWCDFVLWMKASFCGVPPGFWISQCSNSLIALEGMS